MKKVLIGGILGGLTFFLWTWISHTILPIGMMGFQSLPNDELLRAQMKQQIPENGLYFFPGMDMTKKWTKEELKAWEEKYKTEPGGIIVYQTQQGEMMPMKKLISQLVTDLISGLLIAIVISFAVASYGTRVFLVTILGLFSWFSVEFPYYTWYGFPGAFITGALIDQVIGWLLAGLVLSAFVRSKKRV